jgi:hypothetical protein
MIRFICAQPSELYFVWQVEVMLNNFIEMGIDLNYVDIVCTKLNNKIPEEWKKLSNGYDARFFFYEDTRIKKYYTSSIRPNILKQHFKKYPQLTNQTIFYHDCDIIFRTPINFNQFENDDIFYGSNTNWYISYDYIISKGKDVFDKMVEIMDINPQLVIDNNNNSIGAQYILKNIDYTFWKSVEHDCENLFKEITKLNNKKKQENPSYHELQIWTADMWSVLWNIWKCGYKTQCHPDLKFSWAKSNEDFYSQCNIMHNAGITNSNIDYFYKNNYINKLPYNLNLNIKENTASKKYYEWVQKTEKKSVLLKKNGLI